MTDNSKDEHLVATYYNNKGFLQWVSKHNFIYITAQNIKNYFSVFQREQLCIEKKCCDCAGILPIWNTEEDIAKNEVQQKRCLVREFESQENRGKLVSERAKIPKHFEDVSFDGLNQIGDDIKDIAKEYIEHFPHNKPYGLYLYASEHGIGRTPLMWLIIKELLRRNKIYRGFVFHTTSMFIDQLQTDMFTHEHPFRNKVATCDLLLLDDFGREKETDWSSGKLEAIFEERTWNALPIIISSVIPPDPYIWESEKEKGLLVKILKATQSIRITNVGTENSSQP